MGLIVLKAGDMPSRTYTAAYDGTKDTSLFYDVCDYLTGRRTDYLDMEAFPLPEGYSFKKEKAVSNSFRESTDYLVDKDGNYIEPEKVFISLPEVTVYYAKERGRMTELFSIRPEVILSEKTAYVDDGMGDVEGVHSGYYWSLDLTDQTDSVGIDYFCYNDLREYYDEGLIAKEDLVHPVLIDGKKKNLSIFDSDRSLIVGSFDRAFEDMLYPKDKNVSVSKEGALVPVFPDNRIDSDTAEDLSSMLRKVLEQEKEAAVSSVFDTYHIVRAVPFRDGMDIVSETCKKEDLPGIKGEYLSSSPSYLEGQIKAHAKDLRNRFSLYSSDFFYGKTVREAFDAIDKILPSSKKMACYKEDPGSSYHSFLSRMESYCTVGLNKDFTSFLRTEDALARLKMTEDLHKEGKRLVSELCEEAAEDYLSRNHFLDGYTEEMTICCIEVGGEEIEKKYRGSNRSLSDIAEDLDPYYIVEQVEEEFDSNEEIYEKDEEADYDY